MTDLLLQNIPIFIKWRILDFKMKMVNWLLPQITCIDSFWSYLKTLCQLNILYCFRGSSSHAKTNNGFSLHKYSFPFLSYFVFLFSSFSRSLGGFIARGKNRTSELYTSRDLYLELPDKKIRTYAHMVLQINSLLDTKYLCKQMKAPFCRSSKTSKNKQCKFTLS